MARPTVPEDGFPEIPGGPGNQPPAPTSGGGTLPPMSIGPSPAGPTTPGDPSQSPIVPAEPPLPPPPPPNTPTGIGGTFARPGTPAAARFANNRLVGVSGPTGVRFGAGVPLEGQSGFGDFVQPTDDENRRILQLLAGRGAAMGYGG